MGNWNRLSALWRCKLPIARPRPHTRERMPLRPSKSGAWVYLGRKRRQPMCWANGEWEGFAYSFSMRVIPCFRLEPFARSLWLYRNAQLVDFQVCQLRNDTPIQRQTVLYLSFRCAWSIMDFRNGRCRHVGRDIPDLRSLIDEIIMGCDLAQGNRSNHQSHAPSRLSRGSLYRWFSLYIL